MLYSFKVRSKDKCGNYSCKGNLLTVTGVAEEKDKFYKVLASCDACGKIYAFTRLNRRLVK